jgi:hypothetical protein
MYAAPGMGSRQRDTGSFHEKEGPLTKLHQQTNSYSSNDGPLSSVERAIAYISNFLVG